MKSKTNFTPKKFLKFLGLVAGFIALFWGISQIYIYFHRDDWKRRTTPLPFQTVLILCKNLQIGMSNRLCNNTNDVYGPDFYPVISKTLKPYVYKYDKRESMNFDDVEEKIGIFRYDCEPVVTTADGFSYYRCHYDFHGDREFIIGILFSYPDNKVYQINTPMGED